MVILIGNQKGGAGKSTLTLLLANYLSQVRRRRITVLDMDYQQSIVTKYEKAKVLENPEPYEVIPCDLKHFPVLLEAIQRKKGELLLIDLPGKMDDDGLIPVFLSADLILCPFNYDEFSVDSTLLFAMVTQRINNHAPLLFVPNRIKTTVRYETRQQVDQVLERFGKLCPGIADRVDFQRLSTNETPAIVLPVVLPLLEHLYEKYIPREGAS
ncbi:ParA family protein [Pedobacter chinensis]|uniref:ParA family protein n=1 Tax=Pedobacter chinensis TaxID=2282421 RepID=A0A369PP60_9SPHI|nr:ParA family protein [Pedobacter chinensis]RDC54324.1 ParA family protein [Pedobacter chinensis]